MLARYGGVVVLLSLLTQKKTVHSRDEPKRIYDKAEPDSADLTS